LQKRKFYRNSNIYFAICNISLDDWIKSRIFAQKLRYTRQNTAENNGK